MNTQTTPQLTDDMVPPIRSLVYNGSVNSAIVTLFLWGIINIGGFLVFGNSGRELIAKLRYPDVDIYVLIYGTAAIGAMMLLFALLGKLTRAAITILLSGMSLIVVGAWNITHDFMSMGILGNYGYTIEKIGTFWIILGACQCIWGWREMKKFGFVKRWKITKISKTQQEQVTNILNELSGKPEDITNGFIRATVTIPGPLGLDFLKNTSQYFGQLGDNKVILITKTKDNYLAIDKECVRKGTWLGNGALIAECDDKRKEYINLSSPSVITIKKWADIPISANDIWFLASEKKATLDFLFPFLKGSDIQLQAAAISALGSLADEESKKILTSSLSHRDSKVRIGAIQGVYARKINEPQEQIAELIKDADKDVRASAAEYLADLGSPHLLPRIEEALKSETDKRTAQLLKKAIKKLG